MYFKNQRLLLFKGTGLDSNKDGFLNDDDYQQLYIFHLNQRKLFPIEIANTTIKSFEAMPETDLIYLRVGMDKNQDGKFDELREPYKLYTYNVTTHETSELISAEMQKKLQEVIE